MSERLGPVVAAALPGRNGDGLEFGGSSNAVVASNFFDTADDVINFAAGQGKYGALGPPSGKPTAAASRVPPTGIRR